MADTPMQNNNELVVVDDTEIEDYFDMMATLPVKAQRFIHLYLTGQYTISKLAQLLEIHPNTIYKWLKNDDVQYVIREMQKATHEMVATQLKTLTLKAINKLNALIDSPIDGVALQAVKDILDRSGHKAKQEIKIDKTVTTIEEQMKQLIDNTIVEADYKVIEDEIDEQSND